MRREMSSDFLVDTNGHCFICLKQVSTKFKADGQGSGSATQTSHSSVHSLAQYLKLDISKVFHEAGSIPFDLLDSVRRSKLKVSLCQPCCEWNERIAALCRQREKIETEVSSYLGLIHGSLSNSNRHMDSTLQLFKLDDDTGSLEKLRIVKALRLEATQRCSAKLDTVRPRVKVKNLTLNQVFLQREKTKSRSPKPNHETLSNMNLSKASINFDVDQVKFERSYTEGNDCFDADYEEADLAEDTLADFDMDKDPFPMDNMPNLQTEAAADCVEMRERISMTLPTSSTKTSASPSTNRKVKELSYVVNPETGKFKCNICSVEVIRKEKLKIHYESVHLKIKHKCNLCGKEFSKLSSYKRHHKTAHVGVRFICTLCGKCFTKKQSLSGHQQTVHLGKGYECSFCVKKFTRTDALNRHLRLSHPQS